MHKGVVVCACSAKTIILTLDSVEKFERTNLNSPTLLYLFIIRWRKSATHIQKETGNNQVG